MVSLMRRRREMMMVEEEDIEMKTMTQIATIDFSDEAQRVTHTINVNNAVEFYITWADLTNESTTNDSSLGVKIDGSSLASNGAIPTKKTGGAKSYGWASIRWNGYAWIYMRSAGAISQNNAVSSNMITQYWPGKTANTPAQSISIEPGGSGYKAINGIIKVWAR
jgi:hypothetical protein